MTPFRTAAIFAILLAGAGSAQAAYVSEAGNAIDPTAFGGFETVAVGSGIPSLWVPDGGALQPTAVGVNTGTSNSWGGNNYLRVADYSSTGTSTDGSWTYVGLQNLAVTVGDQITISAYVKPHLSGDSFSISYGTAGSVPTGNSAQKIDSSVPTGGSGNNKYSPETISFIATSPTIAIDFGFYWGTPVSTNTDYAYLDGVSVTDTVPTPEPASMALLGAGLLGLGFARRRKAA